jgi:hypothetical protein
MAGIQGLNFNSEAIACIKGAFNTKDWTQWGIFGINSKDITVQEFGIRWDQETAQGNWKQFLKSLPDNNVRYALCNFVYVSPMDNIERTKVVFIMWAPDTAKAKYKMKASMHYLDVKHQIEEHGGIQLTFQANEVEDISYTTVLEKIKKVCYCF